MREGADKQTLRDSIFGDLRNAAHHSLVLKHPVEASYCSINQPSERGQHKKTAATKKEQHPRVSKYFGRPSNNLDRRRRHLIHNNKQDGESDEAKKYKNLQRSWRKIWKENKAKTICLLYQKIV